MVGENIRKLRESKGYTQYSLGDILSLSPSTIGMYEQGRRLPDTETLIRMCDVFNVSSDYLLELTDTPKPYEKSHSGENLHQRLKRLIEDSGMDSSTVAEIVKIRKSRLDDILSGKSPNINELQVLAECFWESTDYILCITDEHPLHGKLRIDSPTFQSQLTLLMDGYTELEITNELDISIMRLRKLLSGEEIPNPDLLKKMSELFRVSTDFLLGIRHQSRSSLLSGQYPFSMDSISLERIQTILKSDSDEYMADSLGLTVEELFLLYHYGFVPHIAVITELCKIGRVSPDYLLGFSNSVLVIQEKSDEDSLIHVYGTYYKKKVEGSLSEQILQQDRDNFMKQSVAADIHIKEAKQ